MQSPNWRNLQTAKDILEIQMNILIFLGVTIASYYLMTIVQTVLHRDYGHKKRIKAVFAAHAIGHHGL